MLVNTERPRCCDMTLLFPRASSSMLTARAPNSDPRCRLAPATAPAPAVKGHAKVYMKGSQRGPATILPPEFVNGVRPLPTGRPPELPCGRAASACMPPGLRALLDAL